MSSGPAHVEDIDALRQLRTGMIKFGEAANIAMNDAESELRRVLTWLETEQDSFWQQQIRKRHEIVERCKEAVRMKKLFKSATGHTQSAIDEEKALKIAIKRLEEAQQKLLNVKKWRGKLAKEIDIYKGSVQRLNTSVQVDIPLAIGRLAKMIQRLEAYVALNIPGYEAPTNQSESGGMAQADPAGEANLLSDPRNLRRTTPPDSVRAAAIPTPAPSPFALPPLPEIDQAKLASLNLPPASPDPALTVTIAPEAFSASILYLERLAPATPTDSGWYIAPANDLTIEPCQAIPLAALLAQRPDLAPLLSLSPHTLIVIGAAGVTHLFDPNNHDLWTGQ
jgi:hypothetical protein